MLKSQNAQVIKLQEQKTKKKQKKIKHGIDPSYEY